MHSRCWRTAAALGAAAVALGAAGAAGAADLPSGRAYELVTPPSKYYGVGVGSHMTFVRSARAGDSVFFDAFEALPGSYDGMGHDSYRADRDASGWATTPLTPGTQNPAPDPSVDPMGPLEGVSDDGQWALYDTSRPIDPADNDYDPGFMAAAPDLYLRGPDGTYTWVSPGPADPGGYSNNEIDWGWLSADGSTVVFESPARLLPEDAGRTGGIGLYAWRDGALHLVGVDDDGNLLSPNDVHLGTPTTGASPGGIGANAVSRDGRRIFFTVDGRVYVRIDSTVTRSIAPGSSPSATQRFAGASADGSVAYFTTAEKLTVDDPDTTPDLYRYDIVHNTVGLVSKGAASATSIASGVQVSDDGQRVYFQATGALTAGAPDGTVTNNYNLYLADGNAIRYVATVAPFLSPQPGCDISLSRAWQITPDGAHAVWTSTVQSTSDDHDAADDIFEYSADTGNIVRVSGTGTAGNGTPNAALIDAALSCSELRPPAAAPRSMSDDGRFAFFQTTEAVAPEDANDKEDVYQHDLQTGETSLISGGTGDRESVFLDSSPSGRDVFFTTFDQLAPQDIDGRYDLYDARIGGGFPIPDPALQCQGDDCQGASHGSVPGAVTPGSASVKGSGSRPPGGSQKPTLVLERPSAAQLRAAVRSGRLKLTVRASAAGKVVLRVRMSSGRRLVTVGSRTVKVTDRRTTSVTIVLSSRARRALERQHRLTLSVLASLAPGNVVKTLSVQLRLPERARGAAARSTVPSVDHR